MPLADVHAHLTHPKLIGRAAEIVENARAQGLAHIVSNGLNPADNQAVLDLAARFDLVRPALGLYPVDAVLRRMRAENIDYPSRADDVDPDEAVAWVRDHVQQAFAIGEIGLDGYWVPESLWDEQERVFRALVQLAIDHDKAIIIHTRKRETRCYEILQEMKAPRVNWHCFCGRVKLGRRAAEESGHYFSIPANAFRAQNFTRMLEKLPREQLLLETDCPYLSPDKDKDNEPANIRGTSDYAAQLWELSPQDSEALFDRNFSRFFAPELQKLGSTESE